MGIYRGPGGSGDAVNDSSSETRLAVEARDAALAAQAAAEAAQAAAEDAQLGAETALANIDDSEAQAETAATNAASSASSASTSATNAASSASSASTSATNAASSASSASSSASAASTSASNAASSASSASSSASSASTSATNAANSASAASTSETNASNSATAAASSASSASSSASTATTQASNASTSATNAASSASSASSSASTATSQAATALVAAGNAATSATNAASSASVASTSASNAATSATAAQAAQAAAEAAFDAFDDIYLGAKSSNPTVDNDGNALTTGDQYFNTVSNELRVWNGSSWQAASTVGGTVSSLTVTGAFSANGGATLGDASGDALTINSSAVSIPNGLNFDSNTLVIDATNNRVGVGTASPSTKIHALSTSGDIITADGSGTTTGAADTGSALAFIGHSGSSAVSSGKIGAYKENSTVGNTAYYTAFFRKPTGAGLTEAMRLDSSGNLGLGVTPSAWNSSWKAFEIGGLGNGVVSFNGTDSRLYMNTYYTAGGVNTYARTGAAALYVISSSAQHQWFYAASGTAGNAITFTQAMTLDASGNLMLGRTSSSNYRAQITGSADLLDIAGTSVSAQFHNKTADIFMIGVGSGDGIAFATNGNTTERMRIDSSGNLGLGVTPSAWDTTSSVRAIQLPAGALWNYNAAGSSSNMFLGTNYYWNGTNRIYLATGTATEYQQLQGQHRWFNAPSGTAGTAITFTQAMTLNASGNLALQGGTTTATGVGITFPATQSASTDANCLDDYEEGTFTPTLSYTTPGTLSVTYTNQNGYYTKVGNLVTVNIFIQLSAFTKGTASGDLILANLPFTSKNATRCHSVGNVGFYGTPTSTTAGNFPFVALSPNTSYISVIYSTNNGINTVVDPDANSQYFVTITYMTA
jgi:hypothetical protein